MLNGLVQTEAIVLRTYRLAEADKIVVAFGAHTGMVRGVARGARRLKNRFGASLELWTLVNLELFAKEQRELVSLRSAEIISTPFKLAAHGEVTSTLDYLSELLIAFVPPGEPNPKVYRMARACLSALYDAPVETYALTRYFEVWLLKLSGFLPSFTCCQQCGRDFGLNDSAAFGAQGTLLCRAYCAPSTAFFMSAEGLRELRLMRALSPANYLQQYASAFSREVGAWSHGLIERVLEKPVTDKLPPLRDAKDDSYLQLADNTERFA